MKKIAVLLILLFVCSAAFGEELDGIVYRLEGPKGPRQRAIITGYTGGAKVVAVNDKIQGIVVSRVAGGAFAGQGLTGVDIPAGLDENGLIVENGAFTGNAIDRVYIGANVTLQPNSFDNNFAAYYNTTRRKAAGTYRYDAKWMTDEEWITEQARLRRLARENEEEARKRVAAEEARRKAEEDRRKAEEDRRKAEEARRAEERRRREAEAARPRPQPVYTPSYSDSDVFGIQFLYGSYINAGYIDWLSSGFQMQLGFGMDFDEIQLNFLGQAEVGLSLMHGVSYGYGGIGELFFDDEWGLGFGPGRADAWYEDGGNYLRGALLIRGEEISKITIYGDYFSAGADWRFGISFLFDITEY
ncbi:MAG: hypothetical protein LBQ57_02285 [Spirochaetales bacterium]|jgi:hypothetical protein|nr:hypothetical protein [Spirochaetales bacterium]